MATTPAAGSMEAPDRIAPEASIVLAYRKVTGGRDNVRVRLADLRGLLSEFTRNEIDEALLGLAMSGRAALYRLDNPQEIDPRDRAAVLLTPSGEERHVVYLGGQGP